MKTYDESLKAFFEWRRDGGFAIDPEIPQEFARCCQLSHLIDKIRNGEKYRGVNGLEFLAADYEESKHAVMQMACAGYSYSETADYLLISSEDVKRLHLSAREDLLSL